MTIKEELYNEANSETSVLNPVISDSNEDLNRDQSGLNQCNQTQLNIKAEPNDCFINSVTLDIKIEKQEISENPETDNIEIPIILGAAYSLPAKQTEDAERLESISVKSRANSPEIITFKPEITLTKSRETLKSMFFDTRHRQSPINQERVDTKYLENISVKRKASPEIITFKPEITLTKSRETLKSMFVDTRHRQSPINQSIDVTKYFENTSVKRKASPEIITFEPEITLTKSRETLRSLFVDTRHRQSPINQAINDTKYLENISVKRRSPSPEHITCTPEITLTKSGKVLRPDIIVDTRMTRYRLNQINQSIADTKHLENASVKSGTNSPEIIMCKPEISSLISQKGSRPDIIVDSRNRHNTIKQSSLTYPSLISSLPTGTSVVRLGTQTHAAQPLREDLKSKNYRTSGHCLTPAPAPQSLLVDHLTSSNQGCIKFLIPHPWGGGSLSNPLGKNFKLWRGEGNLRAFGKNITW